MNEEIIIHKNQSQLDDFLKEENLRCLGCRWCNSYKTCLNSASEFFNKDISFTDVSKCDSYFPNNEMELFSNTDEDTERLDFE